MFDTESLRQVAEIAVVETLFIYGFVELAKWGLIAGTFPLWVGALINGIQNEEYGMGGDPWGKFDR